MANNFSRICINRTIKFAIKLLCKEHKDFENTFTKYDLEYYVIKQFFNNIYNVIR